MTNRTDWTAEEVVTAYSGQQQIEQVFRGLKDGDWLGSGPMYHWTDSKIRVHAFYCMLGDLAAQVHLQRWMRVTVPVWALACLKPARLIRKVEMARVMTCNMGESRWGFGLAVDVDSKRRATRDRSPWQHAQWLEITRRHLQKVGTVGPVFRY